MANGIGAAMATKHLLKTCAGVVGFGAAHILLVQSIWFSIGAAGNNHAYLLKRTY
jgi:hypothetical protein